MGTEPRHPMQAIRRPSSLQGRVLRAVLLLMLFGGVLTTALAWVNGRQAAWASYDRILVGAANDIAESIRIQDGRPEVDLPVSAFKLLAQAPDDRVSYAVRGPDGTLITGYDDAAFRPDRGGRTLAPDFFDAPLQDDPARYVEVTRLFAERDFSGPVRISVGQTLRARQAMARTLMTNALLPIGLTGVLLLISSFFMVRAAVRPLERVAENLRDRDPYDLTPVPTDNLPTEMEVVLIALNRFMARLEQQMGVMRNLISDTAHQLRTPVAAIRVQAEGMMEESNPATRRRTLERLVGRTRGLGRLLDQLLSRAMVIHRSDNLARQPLDLRDIVLDVLEQQDHALLAPQAEVQLVIGEDAVTVMADAFSLQQAAGNLLSNALTHGRAPVRMGADRDGDMGCLWVQDSGPGPKAELITRMGQRFERSQSSGEGSRGLGMSIVHSVAHAYGGEVALEPRPDGFRVTLRLPLKEDAQ